MGFSDFLDSLKGYQQIKLVLSLPETSQEKPCIAFYSEMGSDRIYFEGIMQRLVDQHQQKILYITSGESDPYLKQPLTGMTACYIGNGTMRTTLFKEINIPLFVMTLPDLETFYLKRSVHPNVHYAYIFHSLVSTHMVYRHQAFDAYDTLLCVGPHHEREIREAEALFNLPPKNLLQHGYPRIDKIMTDVKKYFASQHADALTQPTQKNGTKVLVAPSWGENSIATRCAEPLVKVLLDAGHNVIFRPHPMTLRDDPAVIQMLENTFGQHQNFKIDKDIANADSLFESDIMISDWSGVALEFGLGLEKPVIFIDTPPKCNNTQFSKWRSLPVEMSLREQLGGIVSPENLQIIPDLIEHWHHRSDTKNHLARLREQTIYNVGRSDEVGAKILLNLLHQSKKISSISSSSPVPLP